ncbi:alpha-tubulin suppressor-like RCC1 family protein [Microbacterium natoriense]|uniref:Alpha-tubulin suppressor-like RCC1 family protein n=1 Tax=Microbacterium natoriense TaxID=284570 RepID=A0AAW8EWQ9_9MICO|nr:hypothetical protein [Microbacterium natoriense]MDQ0647255.1 alpha-tubulin suppressor-like RCC1 family protein [Microbacterium natoriense]
MLRTAAMLVAAALTVGAPTASWAAATNPTPDKGSTIGGTEVTIPAPAGVTFVQVAAGVDHTLAIGSDQNTYAWGFNSRGQLGTGNNTTSNLPVLVHAPAGVTFTQVSAGAGHSLALGSDGNAYAWGNNESGQLGDGGTTNTVTPVRVSTPAGLTFTHLEAGDQHSLALGFDGKAYAWGDNRYGQLGDGSRVNTSVPVQTNTPAGVSVTRIGGGSTHSLALGSDGNAYGWGDNFFGQLGTGTNDSTDLPVRVLSPPGVSFTQFSLGSSYTMAVGSDGNTYGWGRNAFGQQGNGTLDNSNVPTLVSAPTGVTFTHVSADKSSSTLAIGSDGNTYAWGSNFFGQLGNGTHTDSSIPVMVHVPDRLGFTQLSGGAGMSMALGDDGNTYAWGFNGGGQLGNGSTEERTEPVRVSAPSAVVTGVTFGGIPGTSLSTQGDLVLVSTPPHEGGPVDIAIEWALGGVPQEPIIYPGGFTYVDKPTLTNPEDEAVEEGGIAVFAVVATGAPLPSISWEVSNDGGRTWLPVSGDPSATVSADGREVTIRDASTAHNAYQYRASATNSEGTVTSVAATLTVTKASPGDGGAAGTGSSGTGPSGLATTGGEPPRWIALGAAALLVVGAAAIVFGRRGRRSQPE